MCEASRLTTLGHSQHFALPEGRIAGREFLNLEQEMVFQAIYLLYTSLPKVDSLTSKIGSHLICAAFVSAFPQLPIKLEHGFIRGYVPHSVLRLFDQHIIDLYPHGAIFGAHLKICDFTGKPLGDTTYQVGTWEEIELEQRFLLEMRDVTQLADLLLLTHRLLDQENLVGSIVAIRRYFQARNS